MFGKGFLQGTQSHLNFLPEMKTDFIFTVLAEEFGLAGGLFLLMLYVIIITYGALVSGGCRSVFGRLLAMGLPKTTGTGAVVETERLGGVLRSYSRAA